MSLLFWFSVAVVAYAYFGYAILLWLLSRIRRRPILRSFVARNVSIIIAARNEEANLRAKIENLQQLDYPLEKLQIVIVSDGSTDQTPSILRDQTSITSIIFDRSHGKASALNEAVKQATGDILIFQDARQTIEPEAIHQLVSCFADPSVGAVSGELILDSSSPDQSLGIYWKIEKIIRKLESETGSVVGVTGAIYAIRRELYSDIPPGTILDDVFVPMHIARTGKRIIFEPLAIARDRIFSEKGKEFSRKVRTLTGNYQLMALAPWLLSPGNPLLFRFVSHKLLRLIVPLLLIIMLVSAGLSPGTLFRVIFGLQILFYILAFGGATTPSTRKFKPIGVAYTFVMLNAAAAIAFFNFVKGKKSVWL